MKWWVGGTVSLLLVILLLRTVDLSRVALNMASADHWVLIPALLVYLAGLWVRALRWRMLVGSAQAVGVSDLGRVMVIGFAVNDLLPARLGELVRAYLLSRLHNVRGGFSLATIAIERAMDGFTLVAFLVVAGAMHGQGWLGPLAVVTGSVMAAGTIILVAVATMPTHRLIGLADRFGGLPTPLLNLVDRFLTSFVAGLAVLKDARRLSMCAVLSVAAWLLETSTYFLVMFGFPFSPRFEAALLGTAAANLGSMVPSSPGYVGTFDLPLQRVLSDGFGVAVEAATAYTFTVHLLLVVPVVILGIFFLWQLDLSLKDVSSQSRRVRTP